MQTHNIGLLRAFHGKGMEELGESSGRAEGEQEIYRRAFVWQCESSGRVVREQ